MRVLLVNEDEVRQLLTMEEALEAVEQGFRQLALDKAENLPRRRARTDQCVLHVMGAAGSTLGFMGTKVYSSHRIHGAQFLVSLFDGHSGALLALVQGDYLGQMRTGAASGVATKYMARPEAAEVGLFGTGKQARTQLQAVCQVRRVRRAVVHSRSEENCRRFADEMSERCRTEVVPVSRPELAAEGKDIVSTATSSREPVLMGSWLAPGAHINAIGSNALGKAELDAGVLQRCTSIVVDSKEQARLEAGDFQQALAEDTLHWDNIHELGQVVVGRYTARHRPEDVTLFKSLGIAVEDVAVAGRVYGKALADGVGRWIDW